MLRKEGGSVHESPLPEGVDSLPCMLTVVGRSLQQPRIIPTTVRLSGISELALLSWHPESVLPLSVLSSLTTIGCGVYLAVSCPKGENKKSPQDSSSNLWGLVQELGAKPAICRYETTCYFTRQLELDGCKVKKKFSTRNGVLR